MTEGTGLLRSGTILDFGNVVISVENAEVVERLISAIVTCLDEEVSEVQQ
jgi:hypothetical protein